MIVQIRLASRASTYCFFRLAMTSFSINASIVLLTFGLSGPKMIKFNSSVSLNKTQERMGVDMLAKMALFKNYQKTATYYTWLER